MVNLKHCFSISDLKKAARKSLPGVMFDYIEGGAEDEITISRNRQSFLQYEFVPRVLKNVEKIDLSTSIQGSPSRLPLVIAPTAMSCSFHYQGESAVARAAKAKGIPYSLSTVATTSIEDISKILGEPDFFQIYVWKDRNIIDDFLKRCKQSHFKGLMLAVDLPTLGNRERDLRNGHGHALEQKMKILRGGLLKPKWLFQMIKHGPLRMANMLEHLPHGADAAKTLDKVNQQFDASVSWNDAKKMRDQWQGNFLLKGIQSVADAKQAVEIGASGIVLSNHGGRQLDGAPPAMDLLPAVKDAVGDDLEVFIDGGVRRGSDIIKAIALGAKACLIGRPYLYGLAAGGEAGVERALTILESEMERVMKLIGCDSIAKLDESYLNKL